MRHLLLTTPAVALLTYALTAQVRYTGTEFESYYRWFHQYSQTADFFTDGATLYTFIDSAPLRSQAAPTARVLTRLSAAQPLTNHAIPVGATIESTINGFPEMWFRVTACGDTGEPVTGYVWGGHLAKGWRYLPASAPGQADLAMLGLVQDERRRPEDIRASLRLLRGGEVLQEIELPKLCVFEACGSSTLLRALKLPQQASTTNPLLLEISVLTSGCYTGVDKSLVLWNGETLEHIHQAEYVTGHTYMSRSVSWSETQVCRYSHEDVRYNPVWDCETIAARP